MTIFTPLVLASASLGAVSLWIGQRRWRRGNSVASLKSELLSSQDAKIASLQHSGKPPQSWEDMPKPVQRYFHRIFSQQNIPLAEFDISIPPPTVRYVRSVQFKQKGHMYMNGSWLPFKANQLVSAVPRKPGFVWDASFSTGSEGIFSWLLPWIEVVDAWTLGIGQLTAHVFGVISVVPAPAGQEEKDMLTKGEMQRWLGEGALIPSILLPGQGVVIWNEIDDDRALMTLSDPYTGKEVALTAVFDKNGWMTKVEGMRHRMVGKEFVLTPWGGYFANYEYVPHAGIWVPVHMEGGWMSEEKEELYFKGDNFDFQYDVIEPTLKTAAASIE